MEGWPESTWGGGGGLCPCESVSRRGAYYRPADERKLLRAIGQSLSDISSREQSEPLSCLIMSDGPLFVSHSACLSDSLFAPSRSLQHRPSVLIREEMVLVIMSTLINSAGQWAILFLRNVLCRGAFFPLLTLIKRQTWPGSRGNSPCRGSLDVWRWRGAALCEEANAWSYCPKLKDAHSLKSATKFSRGAFKSSRRFTVSFQNFIIQLSRVQKIQIMFKIAIRINREHFMKADLRAKVNSE